ncbi:MAG: ATP-dependent DNA helicase, partial [Candidatus Heimdallarchaeaceae archaeon]
PWAVEEVKNEEVEEFKEEPTTKKIGQVKIDENNTIEVWSAEKELMTKKDGTIVLAKYNRKQNIIWLIKDKEIWNQKFKEKIWTESKEQKDGSKSKSLKADAFSSYTQFRNFVIQHETAHQVLGEKQNNETIGEYETRINNQAAKVMGLEIYDAGSVVVEPVIEETFEPLEDDPKYEIGKDKNGKPFYMNRGQRNATDKLESFINNDSIIGDDAVFMINGRGGTGKSTIIKKALDNADLSFKSVKYYAPTWKASKVLSVMSGKKVSTVASGLKLKPTYDKNGKPDGFAPDTNPMAKPSMKNTDIMIIDEGSMISQDIYDKIMVIKKNGAKVIFMGDNVQYPPVESRTVEGIKQDSPVFNVKHNVKLTERMRQKEDSPILPITDIFANAVENNTEEELVLNRKNQYNKETDTGVLYKNANDLDSIIDEFLVDYKENPESTRMITYNNEKIKNENISDSSYSLNKTIREKLFGEEKANKNRFFENEIIYGLSKSSPILGGMKTNEDGDPINMENGSEYKIEKLNKNENYQLTYKYAFGKKIGYLDNVDGFEATLTDTADKSEAGIYFLPSNKGLAQIQNEMDRLIALAKSSTGREASQAWQQFYGLKEGYGDVTYAYAINGHKSQGSTYKTVYMMEDNILHGKSSAWTAKERNQGAYVASSRAAEKLVMVSNKNTEPATINKQGSSTTTDTLFNESLGDKIVEDKQIDFSEDITITKMFEQYLSDDHDKEKGQFLNIKTDEFVAAQISILNKIQEAFDNGSYSKINIKEIETSVEDQYKNINDGRQTTGSIEHMTNRIPNIELRWNAGTGTARKSETFLHEILHFMTTRALKENPNLQIILEELKNNVINSGATYEIFLQDIISQGLEPTAVDIKIAKEKFDYTLSKEADPEEFFVYAATNEALFHTIADIEVKPEVFEKFDTGSINKGIERTFKEFMNVFIDVINQVWLSIVNNGGKKGSDLITDTMFTLIEIQNKFDVNEIETKDEAVDTF